MPPPYTFGNAGRNSLRGPGYASFDVGMSKQMRPAARGALTVGLQVFNLFNRANFDLPEHYVDEPTTFGRIFSAKAPRQVQLAARVAFWQALRVATQRRERRMGAVGERSSAASLNAPTL